VDSGSVSSIIHERLAKQLNAQLELVQNINSTSLISANGSPLHVVGMTDLVVNFGGLHIPVTFKVVRNLNYSMIIGSDFLVENGVVIDYRTSTVSIGDDLVRLPLQSYQETTTCVTTLNMIRIPAYTEATVAVKCHCSIQEDEIILLEPLPSVQFKPVAVANSLSRCRDGKTVSRLLNLNPFPVTVRKGTRIASVQRTNNIVSCTPYKQADDVGQTSEINCIGEVQNQTPEELEKFCSEYGFKISPDLTSGQRNELLLLLFQYKNVFARSLEEVKQYPGFELELDLLSNRKVYQRQFRLSPDDSKIAQEQIDSLFNLGLTEESESCEYNSPIFLVNKRDGSKRLIIDLRGINSIIAPKLVQLPKMEELLDEIMASKPKFLTVCDLRSGYYQLFMSKNSRPMTSFTSPSDGRRYQWRVMPFGLNNSPYGMLYVLTNLFSAKKISL